MKIYELINQKADTNISLEDMVKLFVGLNFTICNVIRYTDDVAYATLKNAKGKLCDPIYCGYCSKKIKQFFNTELEV
jgi:hypothetical protein